MVIAASPRIASRRAAGALLVSATFAVAVASSACGGSRGALVAEASGAERRDAADGLPEDVAVSLDADASDAGASADIVAAQPDGAPNDATPTVATAMAVYQTFLQDRRELEGVRYRECFGVPPDVFADWILSDPDPGTGGLELGFKTLDVAALDVCLATIATTPCAELFDAIQSSACARPFQGLVAPDGFCVADDECDGQGAFVCVRGSTNCSSRCEPASPKPPPASAGEGERCKSADGCAAGTYCRYDGPHAFTGVCRSPAPGGPCDGRWNCPLLYACVFDGAGRGTCGIGLDEGAPCRLYGFDALNGPVNDCAYGLYCYPDDQDVFRCQKGQAVGQPCADIPPPVAGENGGPVPCRHGYCDPATQLCATYHASGSPCANGWECDPRNGSCESGRCLSRDDPPLAAGAACLTNFSLCGPGLYCWPDDLERFGPTGTCRPPRADGQPCDGAGCGSTSDCIDGVCRSCLP
jgi:hypothetical protein